jgi:hypothetical protein
LAEGKAITKNEQPTRGLWIKLGRSSKAMLISLDDPELTVRVESLDIQVR